MDEIVTFTLKGASPEVIDAVAKERRRLDDAVLANMPERNGFLTAEEVETNLLVAISRVAPWRGEVRP
jgi:hypothetical protein